jgi:hypothetical protein
MVIGVNGKYEGVKCWICSDVMGIDKILAAKWDRLKKHRGELRLKETW